MLNLVTDTRALRIRFSSKDPWSGAENQAQSEKGALDDAKLCYGLATVFDAKCAEAFNNLNVIYKDRGNLEKAVHHYTLALAANLHFSQTLNNLSLKSHETN